MSDAQPIAGRCPAAWNQAGPATTDADAGAAVRSAWRLWAGLIVMLAGAFMTIMDVMIVNVAIPSIRSDLGASFAEAELVVAGYGLAYAIALITGGRLGDIFGRRRMFLIGLVGFTATSTACGLAPTPAALIVARLLQGLAAAILFPQVFSLIRVTFAEPRQRTTAFAVMGAVLGLAGITGQLLGGVLVEVDLWGLAWRPVFLVNIPIGLAAFAAAPRMIQESRSPDARRLDLAGVGLSALGLGLLLYPLIEGREAGWPAWSIAMLLLSVPVLACFALHQHRRSLRQASPLLETGLFRDRAFAIGMLLVLAFYSSLNAFFLATAFLLQLGLQRSPLEAGLIFSTLGVAFVIASVVAGRLTLHHRRAVLIGGAAIALLGSAIAGGTAAMVSPLEARDLILAFVVLGTGQGLLMTPLLNAILSGIHEGHAGSASGMLSTMQQVGGALGVAIVGILFFATLDHARAAGAVEPAAYAQAFTAAAIYSAAATAITLALLFALPHGRAPGR
ncbi:MFS transporter [Plastoroseomonas hellenica]|uniref:MFS transporter n=1 Tax=Plastoroseomonas hellenica TaxID=2687306 RepID=UPI001BAA8C17|nr:MFS transporter [Plastoroseomonas hellenica]MBR0645662.1 MFS transporter [Plastoroseomonas hellenica]